MYFFYPIFLCLLPLHSIFAQNYVEISLKDYTVSILFILLFIIIGISGLNYFTNDLYLSELLFCIVFFLLLNANYAFIGFFSEYQRTKPANKIFFSITLLTICFVISSTIVSIKSWINFELLTKFLFYITGFITTFVLSDIAQKLVKLYSIPQQSQDTKIQTNKELPDIYHIIADCHTGFARKEYCDNYFKEELQKRGFSIYENAKSNYNFTQYSIPSMLNMDYIQDASASNSPIAQCPALQLYGKNLFFSLLKNRGYKMYFAVCKEFEHLIRSNRDFNIINNIYRLPPPPKVLLLLTFSSFISVYKKCCNFDNPQTTLFNILEDYKRLCSIKTHEPKYCFTHFLAPHSPYLFTETGAAVRKEEYRNVKHYYSYLKFVNKEILKLIDTIKSNCKENSIIIIHGDHSIYGQGLDWHKTLLCAYFPPKYNSQSIKNDISLVNLFRMVSNEIFKTNYTELPNRYFSENKVYENTRILEQENFAGQFEKLQKELKNKKVVLYGAGEFFKALKENFDLGRLNILAVADINFIDNETPQYNEQIGFDTISPLFIHTLKPDIVLLSVLETFAIEKYCNDIIFKDRNRRFKYRPICRQKLSTKILKSFENN